MKKLLIFTLSICLSSSLLFAPPKEKKKKQTNQQGNKESSATVTDEVPVLEAATNQPAIIVQTASPTNNDSKASSRSNSPLPKNNSAASSSDDDDELHPNPTSSNFSRGSQHSSLRKQPSEEELYKVARKEQAVSPQTKIINTALHLMTKWNVTCALSLLRSKEKECTLQTFFNEELPDVESRRTIVTTGFETAIKNQSFDDISTMLRIMKKFKLEKEIPIQVQKNAQKELTNAVSRTLAEEVPHIQGEQKEPISPRTHTFGCILASMAKGYQNKKQVDHAAICKQLRGQSPPREF